MIKGTHLIMDLEVAPIDKNYLDEIANIFFTTKESIIEDFTNMKIVHKHLHIFNNISISPLGWTSVLLLDASHFSSHCYSDKGLIALDIFTCGDTDTNKVLTHFIEIIEREIFGVVKIKKFIINSRF